MSSTFRTYAISAGFQVSVLCVVFLRLCCRTINRSNTSSIVLLDLRFFFFFFFPRCLWSCRVKHGSKLNKSRSFSYGTSPCSFHFFLFFIFLPR
jgi:hypothetical protein